MIISQENHNIKQKHKKDWQFIYINIYQLLYTYFLQILFIKSWNKKIVLLECPNQECLGEKDLKSTNFILKIKQFI